MRDAHRCLDGQRRGGRGRAAFLPHERSVLWTRKETLRKKSSYFIDFCEYKISWLAFLPMAIFLRLVQKRSRGSAKKDGILLVRKTEMAVCSLYIEDALPSTSHCTCRLNNVHTYQQHIYNIPVTCFFRGPLSQIQCSTSRLAASCCITPGGTGTLNAHKRGARHHAVPHG